MLRDVTIGQFFPGNSLLHKIDPRAKIVMLIAFIVMIFCTFNYYSLIIAAASTILIMLLSGVPVKLYLKSLKMIIMIVVFTSVLNIFYGTGEPIYQLGFLKITQNGINNAVFVTVRIICLIIISSSLTFTTSPTDLTDAIERLMKPLKVFHIKVHEIALMMSIALRFIPTLLEETDKIMQAQKARGADMETGSIIKRAKALLPVLIPLIVSAFRRAIELATAMECRCYQGGSGRTRMKVLHLKSRDFLAFAVVSIVFTGVILCNIFLTIPL